MCACTLSTPTPSNPLTALCVLKQPAVKYYLDRAYLLIHVFHSGGRCWNAWSMGYVCLCRPSEWPSYTREMMKKNERTAAQVSRMATEFIHLKELMLTRPPPRHRATGRKYRSQGEALFAYTWSQRRAVGDGGKKSVCTSSSVPLERGHRARASDQARRSAGRVRYQRYANLAP